MKEIILNYTQYNVWANKQIVDLIQQLTEEDCQKEIGGSFPTLRKTIAHIWFAEDVWLQRLLMAEKVIAPEEDETMSFKDMCKNWIASSEGLLQFTEKIHDDRGLIHEFHYNNIKGEHFKSQVWECLHHVCNHSTFHRGQVINFLRMLGVSKIPSTDFITYCRGKKG